MTENNEENNEENNKNSAQKVNIVHLSFFAVLSLIILFVATYGPSLDNRGFFLVRILIALCAGGLAAVIPGFFEMNIKWQKTALRAGGALGVIALVLTYNPPHIERDEKCSTDINLAGTWDIKTRAANKVSTIGEGSIKQRAKSCNLEIYGNFANVIEGEPKIHFSSDVAKINGNKIKFIYTNTPNNESGVCEGRLNAENQNEFEVSYNDLIGRDANEDPKGVLTFVRRQKK